ncbi:MAG: sulfite exporter TauE/SafE family protein, partial [Pseudomonadota bacterium]
MELDLTFFALAVPAVLLAGISKGGFGSGAAFVAAPLLALIIEPQYAVGVMLPLLMLMDVTSLRPYWRRWDWPNARTMMIGAIP